LGEKVFAGSWFVEPVLGVRALKTRDRVVNHVKPRKASNFTKISMDRAPRGSPRKVVPRGHVAGRALRRAGRVKGCAPHAAGGADLGMRIEISRILYPEDSGKVEG
jgi:hypothetical protein